MRLVPVLLLAASFPASADPARDPVEVIRQDPDYIERRIRGVGLGAWGGPLRLDLELDQATHLPTRSIWIERPKVSAGDDPFLGKTEIALVAQVYPSEEAARAAIQATSLSSASALVYGFYRGEQGIIFPTVISPTTAPRVTQALCKVLEQERENAKQASAVLLESVLVLGGARIPLAPVPKPAAGRLIVEAGRTISSEEMAVAGILVREGRTVRVLAEGAKRTADFLVDGLPVELKTVSRLTSKDLAGALGRRILEGAGQAPNIIIDARRQAGLTAALAGEAIRRAYLADKQLMRLQTIRILGDGFDILIPRLDVP